MFKKIILHGSLKKLWPHDVVVKGSTVAECVDALCKVTGRAFSPKPRQGRIQVAAVGCDRATDLFMPYEPDEIHLVPSFAGGKKGGLTQILVGAVLMAAAVMIPGLGTAFATAMFNVGLSLVLGGLLALISQSPEADKEDAKSRYLGARGNTTKIGTRIPILYGEVKHEGHYISFNVDAVDVAR